MGFFRDITDSLGFTKPNADQYATDPLAYSDLYEKALAELKGIGWDTEGNRAQIIDALGGQLGDLENNAAGRKKNYLEDMGRSFSTDTQNLARAKGGTGSLAGALRNSGQMYDSQARATSRGLNDLYSQANQDLAGLTDVQNTLFDQSGQKANAVANTYNKELASRRGQLNQNQDNAWNIKQNQGKLLGGTLGAIAKGGAAAAGGS